MVLGSLTTREAVLAAIAEFDDIGRTAFLEKYGFGKSRSYFVLHEGSRYDSKELAGAAIGHQHPDEVPPTADQFSGGEQTVARRMEKLGFEVERQASRNPDWTEDELILALDLYFRRGLVDPKDPEVIELSNLLGSLSIHPPKERTASFRNPNGVARKLSNLANFDPEYTGKPTHGNRLDGEVYQAWGDRPADLNQVVIAIKAGQTSNLFPEAPEPDEEEVEAPEGRLLYRHHRVRERSSRLKKKKIEATLKTHGKIACEACGFDFGEVYGERGEGFIECHHVKPLHEAGQTTTRLSDLALVCSNCHRMIHRRSPWPTPHELGLLVTERSARF